MSTCRTVSLPQKKERKMKNVLIVSGHPNLDESFANKIILDELQVRLPQADFAFLDQLYPNFQINVATEQRRLVKADIIVLQFPFFWYGIPSLMKKWVEDVFVHGFSHGSTGNKLHGKKLILSFTSGATEEMYRHGGLQNYPIEEFMPPFIQLANLCGLEWQGYVYSGDLSYASRHDEKKLQDMRSRALEHAGKLVNRLTII